MLQRCQDVIAMLVAYDVYGRAEDIVKASAAELRPPVSSVSRQWSLTLYPLVPGAEASSKAAMASSSTEEARTDHHQQQQQQQNVHWWQQQSWLQQELHQQQQWANYYEKQEWDHS